VTLRDSGAVYKCTDYYYYYYYSNVLINEDKSCLCRILFIIKQTSVVETIPKTPLAEAQTALGKQKIRSVEC